MRRRPTRRAAVTGAAAMAAAASSARAAADATSGRPNILWLVSEDNGPFLGTYGDRVARTPHLDRLASEGVRFANAFSTAPVCAPSRFSLLTGVYPQSCGPAHHMRARAKLPADWRTYPERLRSAGYHCTNNAKTDYNADVVPAAIWDQTGPTAHWRGRPPGKPFLAVFNFETTHESRLFRPVEGAITPDQVRVPSYLPDTPAIRADIAAYYNLMTRMDAEVAARLAELEADGLADDTIVIYASDNGGALPRSKRYAYDEGLRTPLIVRCPPRWAHLMPARPGGVVDDPVTSVDFAPTLLALAGEPPGPHMQGRPFLGPGRRPDRYAFGMRNRMDERYDFVRTVTDGRWRYIRNYMPHRPWGMHGAFEWMAGGYQAWEDAYRAGRLSSAQARFFGPKPFEELYDLETDPDQVRNLAGAPAARGRTIALSRRLDAHMLAIRDVGFVPEGLEQERPDISRDPDRYPLPRIMALAAAAASRQSNHRLGFEIALEDPDPVIRYWAATGLLILERQAASSQAALAAALQRESVGQVQVPLAETLAGLGDASGVVALGRLADEPYAWPIRLQALNSLTALGEGARPALPVVRKAAEGSQEYLRSAGRYLAAVLEGAYAPNVRIFSPP